jgi:hypothetical protein
MIVEGELVKILVNACRVFPAISLPEHQEDILAVHWVFVQGTADWNDKEAAAR